VARSGSNRVRVWGDDPDTAAWLLTPRHDLVAEVTDDTEVDGHRFVQQHGPFRRYHRTVTQLADGRWREEIGWQLNIPWFGWLLRLGCRHVERQRHPRRAGDAAGRLPWWAPPERLDAHHVMLLGLLAAASLSSAFVNTLFTQTVAFAAEEFDIGQGGQGVAAAIVRLGIVLALPITWLADRKGRRRMMLVAAWAAPLVSALGAVAPSFPLLVVTQTAGRPLGIALDVIIAVVAVEEMPRGARAYAISVLAMASGLGAGVAVMALPLADVATWGWRLVYVMALVWLIVAVDLTRRLPETQRFRRLEAMPRAQRRPRLNRARFALLATVAVLTNLFVASASIFQNRFLRDERGYSATSIAVFTLATATPAALGLLVGGRLADRRGRRLLAAIGVPAGAMVLAIAFTLAGPALWLVTFLGGVISTIAFPALAVYRRELFPTGSRGRVNGLLVGVALAGGSVGLLATGWLLERGWSYGAVMTLLAGGSVIAGVIVAVGYPETSRRELEDLNPEDRLPGSFN
jgi:MFS family permease